MSRGGALGAVLLLLPLLAAAHLCLGAVPLTPGQMWQALRDPQAAGFIGTMLWTQRLPRLVVALFVGAVLALSGLVLQKVLRNILVSPSTLGLNAGASLAAVLSTFLPGAAARGIVLPPLLGASAALGVTLLLSRLIAGQGDRRLDLILAGSMVGILCSSLATFVIGLDPQVFGDLMGWLLGDIGAFDHRQLPLALPPALLAFAVIVVLNRRLDILASGTDQAALLGIATGWLQAGALAAAVLLAAAAVAVVGPIGFVGLVVPNLTRLVMGENGRAALAFTVVAGAGLMVAADLLARLLIAPRLLHVGTVMGMAGGAGFLALILLQRRVAA